MGALLGGSASTVHVELGATGEVKKEVAPYGPGDVKALDARAVVRTVPYHGVHDFEPNLFPCIELAQPELPWLLSPSPDSHGRVSPWLVLVVVEDRPGVTISFGAGNAQILTIEAPAVPGDELPDLAQSWAWAHAQATGTEARRSICTRSAAEMTRREPFDRAASLECWFEIHRMRGARVRGRRRRGAGQRRGMVPRGPEASQRALAGLLHVALCHRTGWRLRVAGEAGHADQARSRYGPPRRRHLGAAMGRDVGAGRNGRGG
jgi:hypothetical protein